MFNEDIIMFGCILSEEEVMQLVDDDKKAKFALEHDYAMDLFYIVENFKIDGFKISTFPTAGKQAVVFGRLYDSMRDDETKKEYEDSVKNKIAELFKHDICCFMMTVEEME